LKQAFEKNRPAAFARRERNPKKEHPMLFRQTTARWLLALIFGLHLALTGCGVSPAAQSTPTPAVIYVTQVITQIVPPTPIPATPAPPPTETPAPPSPTPTWDPLAAPIYYPLPDCVASRLHVGDRAMVSLVGGPNGIRYGRDLSEDTIIAYAQPGSIVEILNGPWCSHGWLVWFVRTADGVEGFTPEGDGNEYWLLPVGP
jgi:hypothetical protein